MLSSIILWNKAILDFLIRDLDMNSERLILSDPTFPLVGFIPNGKSSNNFRPILIFNWKENHHLIYSYFRFSHSGSFDLIWNYLEATSLLSVLNENHHLIYTFFKSSHSGSLHEFSHFMRIFSTFPLVGLILTLLDRAKLTLK